MTLMRATKKALQDGRWIASRFVALWGLLFALGVQGAALQGVEFASLPNDRFEIRLDFDGAPPQPQSYSIEQPARIAIDLVGVKSALGKKSYSLDHRNARSVTVVESKDRTRMIINLVDLAPYSTQVDGNTLRVVLGEKQAAAVTAAAPAPVAAPVAAAPTAVVPVAAAPPPAAVAVTRPAVLPARGSQVEKVDFRRGESGEGKLVVTLSNSGANVDVREEGGKIRVEFSDTRLLPALRRRFDVTDFATPITSIDATEESGKAVMTVTPTGHYDYLAYQADTEFTLSVKPLTAQEQADEQKKKFAYTGEKLSLNFQDIEVRAVLQLIADFTNLNLVASDTVTGRITLRLKNVPWDQALDLVLKTKGLDKRLVGNVLTVAPAAEIAAREKLELETNKQVNELAPLHTDFIEVRYAKAADLLAMLTGKNSILSTRGTASIDKRTNLLIVQDTDQVLAEVRSLLKRLDVPVRQVLIEARIVKARANVSKDLGIQWGGRYGDNDGNNMVIGGSGVRAGVPGPVTGGDVVNLGVTKTGTTTLNLGFVNNSNILNLSLTAIEENGDSQTLAQPKVLTADKQMAKIEQGTEIPYQEATSSGATSTSFKPAVLALEVTPQITPDNRIIMDLQVNQDVPGSVTNGIPSIDTTRIKTQVLVDNGQTVVLGGIYTQDDTFTETKTPLLGDVPYVGSLFKRTSKGKIKSELLIFITPRLDGEGKSSLQ